MSAEQGKANAITRLVAAAGPDLNLSLTFVIRPEAKPEERVTVRLPMDCGRFELIGWAGTMEEAAESVLKQLLEYHRDTRNRLASALAAADLRLRQAEEAAQ